ncbi:hypothetical protein [Exiguobacterium sp. s138]|uniref:hypothetical protein n=1 Tax=Exiguobacterium sp. s138 TaxID=2751202 RepID=UPI001BEBDF9A|nr:hypothetical protein [Exiguobacterium sp. s138]
MFPEELNKEYMKIKETNPTFDWWSYMNFSFSSLDALAFLRFFNPEMIEKDGCYFLKDGASHSSYKTWKEELGDDLTSIEKLINLYEPYDFFSTRDMQLDQFDDDEWESVFDHFSEGLQAQWQMSLNARYPDIPFKVDLFEEHDNVYLTVYVKRET